jgi:hypothetical protein
MILNYPSRDSVLMRGYDPVRMHTQTQELKLSNRLTNVYTGSNHRYIHILDGGLYISADISA